MSMLILGLVLFLGVHSVRIVADDWRTRTIGRIGAGAWKGAYTVISLVGFGLLVWGFGQARMQPVQVWAPPVGMRHLASLLTLVAFVFLAAAYVPGNAIKARMHHPMVLGVKTWALAHQLGEQSGVAGGGRALIQLLLEDTHTCYLGDRTLRHPWGYGCGTCPACELRASGWQRYTASATA